MKSEISALLDDELGTEAAVQTLDALRRQTELREAWDTYQLIGDALRRAPELSPGFSGRVMSSLSREATVLAPAALRTAPGKSPLRFALPIAASVMGIGAVGWVAMSLNAPQPAQVATGQPANPVAATPVASPAQVVRAPSKDLPKEYLVAHQAYSPSSGIQGVAASVRTVSEIRQGAGR